jgi:acyl carrier protein
MTKEGFLRVFEQKLELDPNTLTGKEALEGAPFWDSLAAITFIALADDKCGKEITAEHLAACTTVDDLIGLLGDCIQG